MIKWVATIIGYLLFRLPGALLGFFVGTLIDGVTSSSEGNEKTIKYAASSDFELNLLSLCSIVMKADGKVSRVEMDYVQHYFVRTYGKEKANAIFRTFNKVIKKKQISTQRICNFLNERTEFEVRLQLIHFLFGIAEADTFVSNKELLKIEEIARYLRITNIDFESIKAMFIKSADNAYKILEIEKLASHDEVKKAYRTMAKKYHPDKVNTENEAIKKGAEEKFKEVQKAYETIQKERGFN